MTQAIRDYVHAVYGLDAVVQRMGPGDWTRPSPCEGWSARDVVVHNAWAFDMFTGMVAGRPASVPASDGAGGVPAPSGDGYVLDPAVIVRYGELNAEYDADPVETWNRDRDALVAALDAPEAGAVRTRSPWGATSIDEWLAFAVWDPLVHTWDLAEAVGQPTVVDATLCASALERAQRFDAAHDLRRPGVAGPQLDPVDTSCLGRLLAFAGRDRDWRTTA